jgi:hypothetical protein
MANNIDWEFIIYTMGITAVLHYANESMFRQTWEEISEEEREVLMLFYGYFIVYNSISSYDIEF